MVIVDTTVWVDYLRGVKNRETQYLDAELGRQPFGLTDLILCEVLKGVPSDEGFVQTLRELQRCLIFGNGGEELAIEAAVNSRGLQRRGHTVRKTVDCLIATFCLRRGFSLLHRDRDYDPFEELLDLAVVHP